MLKKLCYLVPVVVLIMVMGTNSARGDALHWTGAGTNPYWHTPQNWDKGVVPQAGDDAYCKHNDGEPDPNFTALSSDDPICLLCIADVSANGVLNIDGGTINVVSALRASKASTGPRTAVVNMKGGTISLYGRNVSVGPCYGNNDTDGSFSWGPNGPGETVQSTWNMTGGLINTGTFTCPSGGTNSASIFNLNGGTVIVREPSSGFSGGNPVAGTGFLLNEVVNTNRTDPNAHLRRGANSLGILNITAGKMIIQGDVTPLFENRVDTSELGLDTPMGLIDPCNVIRAYPGIGAGYNAYIVYDYDQRNDGKTTLTAKAQPTAEAYKPDPVDEHANAPDSPILRWTPGSGAPDHDVYFGTNSASLPLVAELTASDPCQYEAGSLALGTTYFWQVKENDAAAPIWSFVTEGKARGPNPVDGVAIEPNSTRNVKLRWTAGGHSSVHDVYFGTSSSLGAPELVGDNLTVTYKNVQAILGQTNYWRVDEVNTVTVPGKVWSFTPTNYDLIESFEQYTPPIGTPVRVAFNTIWKTSSVMPLALVANAGRDYKDPVKSGQQSMKVSYSHTIAGTGASNALFSEANGQNWSTTGGDNSGAVTLSFWMRGKGSNQALSNLYIQLATGTTTSTAYYSAKVTIPNYSSLLTDETYKNVNIALSAFNGTGKGANFNLNSVKRLFIGSQAGGASAGSFWMDDIRLFIPRCVDNDNTPDPSGKAGAALADITNDCKVDGYDLYKIVGAVDDREWLTSDTTVDANGVIHNATADTQWLIDGGHTGNSGDNALKLGATTDWVDIDDLAFAGDPNNFNAKTVAFWVKVDGMPGAVNGTRQMIFSTSSDWRLHVVVEKTGDSAYEIGGMFTNDFPEPDDLIGPTSINFGEWHHVAVRVSPINEEAIGANKVRQGFYIDGAFAERTTTENHYYNKLFGACLGGLKNGVGQHSNVTVDDFRIYNRALSDADIATLYSGTDPNGSGPLIRFDFDESGGTAVANSGSKSTVNHPVGYALGSGGEPDPRSGVSDGELYTGTDGGKTYINLKDYAQLAKHWLYGTGGANGTWVFP